MATSTHDGKVNFHSYIESGVDPLTGTFSANILLATLIYPDYEIRLCYSPLNQKDFGFGTGWRIPVSVFNKKSKLLSLSDGRLYAVDDKLELLKSTGDVIFEKEGDFGYRVTFRDTGIIELLENGATDDCPCTARYSATGYGMSFIWNEDASENTVKLKEIHRALDENEKLLSISYSPNETEIKIWPNQKEQRKFVLNIDSYEKNNQLNALRNLTFQPELEWSFTYCDVDKHVSRDSTDTKRLISVLTPSRHKEWVKYNTKSLQTTKELRVTEHHTQESETYYQYLLTNKLIQVESMQFRSNGPILITHRHFIKGLERRTLEAITNIDPHIRTKTAIEYRSNHYNHFEPTKAKIITRDFNKNSLLTREKHLIGDDLFFTTTWNYDKLDRLIKTEKNGIRDTFEYLEPTNKKSSTLIETTHTPDTNNPKISTKKYYTYEMFSFRKTAHSSIFSRDTIPVLKFITSSETKNDEEKIYEINQVIDLNNDPESPDYLNIARLYTHTTSYGLADADLLAPNTVAEMEALISTNRERLDKSELACFKLHTPETIKTSTQYIGNDQLTKTTHSIISRFSGLVLSETDLEGNVSDYTWDGLGRLTSIVNNSESEFELTETYEHISIRSDEDRAFLGDNTTYASLKSLVLHTDTSGRKTVAGYDESNRHIQTWECTEDDKWHLILKQAYQGTTIIEKTDIDYYNDTTTASKSYTRYLTSTRLDIQKDSTDQHYDITCATVDDVSKTLTTLYFNTAIFRNTVSHESLSITPTYTLKNKSITTVTLENTNNFRKLELRAIDLFGWCERKTFDSAGNVIRLERYSLSSSTGKEGCALTATLHSTTSQTYDGNKKRTSFTDELGRTTRFEYDFFGRLTHTHLADNSTIIKSYPRHTDKALIESVIVATENNSYSLGEQTFDSLERLTSSTGACTHAFTYVGSNLTPSSRTSGNVTLTYESVKELGSAIKSIKSGSLDHQFHYEKATGLLSGFADETGFSTTFNYGALTHAKKEVITPFTDATPKEQSKKFSPAGKCIEYTDTTGKTQTYRYNAHGNVIEIDDPDIRTTVAYGPFDRILSQEVFNKKNNTRLKTDFTYNALGEETERRIIADDKLTEAIRVEQRLHANGQLAWRKISKDKQLLREESFSYNVRNLLTQYTCNGSDLPVDGYKHAISKLELTYDALANITQCTTQFNNEEDVATFHYENEDVPCQLSSITHTHSDYPAIVELKYDANGCMTQNDKGQVLSYDALNRLKSLQDGNDTYLYHYDPQGKLRSRSKLTARTEWYYQLGSTVPVRINESSSTGTLRITRIAEQVAALTTPDGNSCLLSAERMGTPLVAYGEDSDPALIKCTPFGITNAPLTTAWSGELYDEISGTYHLGERQYSPTLMRFTTPDSWSPFGKGGINCYAYLDPVNCPDPDGHISFWGWLGIAAAVVLGVVVGVVTMGAGLAAIYATGMSVAAAMMVAGGASLIAAGAVGIAAEIVRDSDPATARTLDKVAFGLGIVGTVLTLGAGFARGAAKTALHGLRSGAPRVGRMARYAVPERTLAIEMKPLGSISRGGAQMQAEFIGGSRYAFSTASNMVSGVQSVGSTVILEMVARAAASAPGRLIGITMGMEALLGLGMAAKHHSEEQE